MEGFNLIAWVVPFVILGVASALVVTLLKPWTSNRRAREPAEVTPMSIDEDFLTKVEQEMEELGI